MTNEHQESGSNANSNVGSGLPKSIAKKILQLPPDLYSRNSLMALLIKLLTNGKEAHILDVGGFGGKLSWFLPSTHQVIVLDQKPRPEEVEDEQLANEQYLRGDAKSLPFPDRSFEIVVASDLMEHTPEADRKKIYQELCRVSRNLVIIGAPFKKELVQNLEHIIAQQYWENTGNKHPFLMEHSQNGLPSKEELEEFLKQKNYDYLGIEEGNLVNWVLQQLVTGSKQGEPEAENITRFNEYFNEHLLELGNLEEPTYRTIYCIMKEGKLPKDRILMHTKPRNNFSVKTFSYLLKTAFTEQRKLLNFRKKQLNTVADITIALREKVKELQESHAFQERDIQKMKKLLQDQNHSIEFLHATLNERTAVIAQLEEEKTVLLHKSEAQAKELSFLQDKEKTLQEFVQKQESALNEKNAALTGATADLNLTREQLNGYKNAYEKVITSRAWKWIIRYGKIKMWIKNILWTKPAKLLKNAWGVLIHLGPKTFAKRVVRKLKPVNKDVAPQSLYQKYIEQQQITLQKKSELQKEQENFKYRPVVSIIMPTYKTDLELLKKAVDSVKAQTYEQWELCIADDASKEPKLALELEKYAAEDERIKITVCKENGGISQASNEALKLANGAYVGFLDHDDELASDALFEVVKSLQDKKYDLIYSDEDKLELNGDRVEPFFKPDWSPDLLLSINYITHFAVYRRKLVNDLGGLRSEYDGSQDYDLVLRFTELTNKIKHIPKILYHWRKIPGSTAAEVDAKPYVFEASKHALEDALQRRKIEGEVVDGLWKGSYRVKRNLKSFPLVSIIIPFKDKKEVLQKCLNSIFEKTTYQKYELILVDNRSEQFETEQYLKTLESHPEVTLLKYDKPFNYSAINNFAYKHAKGEILVLLNNDTEILSPGWIEAMLEHAERSEVGAVGAKLLYPNRTLQHAGIVLGVGGIANCAFCRQTNENGYFGQVNVIRNYSAVTAACLMVRKSVYENMGGLDENNVAITFNDVDFCLRLREKGYLIVYTPYACLMHYESLSRGRDVNMEEAKYITEKYKAVLENDPYYNPNLTRERFDFSLRTGDKIV